MKVIFWDYDGVIMDSMPIREQGFVEVLKGFPEEQVQELLAFHQRNGGLSRYVKFRYFYEEIRGEGMTEEMLDDLTKKFSEIMRQLLVNPFLLIEDSVSFIKNNHEKHPMHIVSGSDGNELRFLCQSLGLNQYFQSINGSPTPKKQLVKQIIEEKSYDPANCLLIGDSQNDYDAAIANGIRFYGYNNTSLRELDAYIDSFETFSLDSN